MNYTCQHCHQTYQKSWTDQDVIKEYQHRFPEHMHTGKCVVCDDCYKEIMAWVDSLSPMERRQIETAWH